VLNTNRCDMHLVTVVQYVIGCYSTCSGLERTNGTCSGAGCCKADVPENQVYLEADFNEKYNTSTGCSYIVVMEEKAFNFSTTYNLGTTFFDDYKGQVTVVMDWMILLYTCEAAKRNRTSYACVGEESECVPVTATDGQGYRCKCRDGYQGNPYIKGGCTG
jgi:hypothetical protein